MKCDAKSKTTGKRCKNSAAQGRKKCRFHGGKSLAGPAHPSYKHGKYDLTTKGKLADAYRASLELGAKQLSMREETALLDAQLVAVADCVLGDESWVVAWAEVAAAAAAVDKAIAGSDPAAAAKAIKSLRAAVGAGRRLEQAQQRWLALTETRRRLVDTDGKNLERIGNVLTGLEVQGLAMQLVQEVSTLVNGLCAAMAQRFDVDLPTVKKVARPALSDFAVRVRTVTSGGPAEGVEGESAVAAAA